MSSLGYGSYLAARWQHAWRATIAPFKEHVGHVWIGAGIFLSGLLIHHFLGSFSQIVADIEEWMFGVASLAAAAVAWLVWHFLVASFQLWRNDRALIATQEKELCDRRNYLEIGKELEGLVARASEMLEFEWPVLSDAFWPWYKQAVAAAAKVSEEERSAFETFWHYSPSPPPEDMSDEISSLRGKLRLIMMRAYRKAGGSTDSSVETDSTA